MSSRGAISHTATAVPFASKAPPAPSAWHERCYTGASAVRSWHLLHVRGRRREGAAAPEIGYPAMTDTFSKEKRRAIMQAVRRQRTRPEEVLAGLLRVEGLRFRRNVADAAGQAGRLFPRSRLGNFRTRLLLARAWTLSKGRIRPKTNTAYWKTKVQRNQRRDRRAARQLRALGISVYTVWECELSAAGLPKRAPYPPPFPKHESPPKCRPLPKVKLKFKVAPHIVEDLGLNLYTSLPRVLVEFIANAYDADSPFATIRMDKDRIDAERKVLKVRWEEAKAKAEKRKAARCHGSRR